MITYDSHLHTSFSTDSDTPMEHIVQQAIRNHLEGITFTDHMDYHFPLCDDWNDDTPFQFDTELYFDSINKYKKTYSDQICIYTGVEIGLKEDARKENERLCSNGVFDYVIGSIHLIQNMDPYYSKYWESFEERKALLLYFETTLNNLQNLGNIKIDTLGHLDYIVRYAPSGYRLYSYHKFSDVIDAILDELIKRDLCLEINTAGYKKGDMPNPNVDILRRYRDMGGQWITFGSDAHTTEWVGYRFNDAKRVAAEAGFDHYVHFEQRKPVIHTF